MIPQNPTDRMQRLERLLATRIDRYGPDAPLTQQVVRNLAAARAAVAAAEREATR